MSEENPINQVEENLEKQFSKKYSKRTKIIISISVIALILALAGAAIFPFKDKFLASRYPKSSSQAATIYPNVTSDNVIRLLLASTENLIAKDPLTKITLPPFCDCKYNATCTKASCNVGSPNYSCTEQGPEVFPTLLQTCLAVFGAAKIPKIDPPLAARYNNYGVRIADYLVAHKDENHDGRSGYGFSMCRQASNGECNPPHTETGFHSAMASYCLLEANSVSSNTKYVDTVKEVVRTFWDSYITLNGAECLSCGYYWVTPRIISPVAKDSNDKDTYVKNQNVLFGMVISRLYKLTNNSSYLYRAQQILNSENYEISKKNNFLYLGVKDKKASTTSNFYDSHFLYEIWGEKETSKLIDSPTKYQTNLASGPLKMLLDNFNKCGAMTGVDANWCAKRLPPVPLPTAPVFPTPIPNNISAPNCVRRVLNSTPTPTTIISSSNPAVFNRYYTEDIFMPSYQLSPDYYATNGFQCIDKCKARGASNLTDPAFIAVNCSLMESSATSSASENCKLGLNYNIGKFIQYPTWLISGFVVYHVTSALPNLFSSFSPLPYPCTGKTPGTCTFETRTHYIDPANNHLIESVTAYGKYWNWDITASNFYTNMRTTDGTDRKYYIQVGGFGADLTTVPRYATGPCAGKAAGTCKFDTRTFYKDSTDKLIESVTAYGKYWNWVRVGDNAYTTYGVQGADLTSVPRYVAGPCKGKTAGTCKFDSRAFYKNSQGYLIESVTAYSKLWDWNTNNNLPYGSYGKNLVDVVNPDGVTYPYRQGPCYRSYYYQPIQPCTLTSRSFYYDPNNHLIESAVSFLTSDYSLWEWDRTPGSLSTYSRWGYYIDHFPQYTGY